MNAVVASGAPAAEWARGFDTDDVNFLTAVGNVLSTAIQRHRAEESPQED